MSICDASSSWSGYQYQGKVSIYMVLKIINDFIDEGDYEEYENYSIEIEQMEDFSIIYKGEHKSIHQVKARASDKTINPYLEAMAKLNEEKIKLPNLNLYLHTICNINNWSLDGYKESLKTIIKNRSKSLEQCKKDNEKAKYTKEINYFNNLLIDESFFKNINVYKYPSEKYYCTLDEIRNLILIEIQRYLTLTNQEHKLGSIEIIYNQFIGFMDEYIKERHKGHAKIYIKFEEFKKILDDDKILKRDESYYIYLTKERYIYNMHKYCEVICKNRNSCKEGLDKEKQECKLINLFNLIKNTNLHDLKKIIYKINPHIEILDWERDNNEFVNHLNTYFLCNIVTHEIQYKYDINHNSISYNKDNNSYMPTTIRNVEDFMIPEVTEEYIKSIKNNDFLLKELFESNVFITGNIDRENILDDINDVEEVDDYKKAKDLELEDKLYLKNRVDFRSLEYVKRELI